VRVVSVKSVGKKAKASPVRRAPDDEGNPLFSLSVNEAASHAGGYKIANQFRKRQLFENDLQAAPSATRVRLVRRAGRTRPVLRKKLSRQQRVRRLASGEVTPCNGPKQKSPVRGRWKANRCSPERSTACGSVGTARPSDAKIRPSSRFTARLCTRVRGSIQLTPRLIKCTTPVSVRQAQRSCRKRELCGPSKSRIPRLFRVFCNLWLVATRRIKSGYVDSAFGFLFE